MEQGVTTPTGQRFALPVLKDPNSTAKKGLVLKRFPVDVPTSAWISDPFDPSAPMMAVSTWTPQRTAVGQVDRMLEALISARGWSVYNLKTGRPERPMYSMVTEMMWQGDNATPAKREMLLDDIERFTYHLLREHGRPL